MCFSNIVVIGKGNVSSTTPTFSDDLRNLTFNKILNRLFSSVLLINRSDEAISIEIAMAKESFNIYDYISLRVDAKCLNRLK